MPRARVKDGTRILPFVKVRWLCEVFLTSWSRQQRETFSASLALHAGNSLVTGEFPLQRPVTQSFDVLSFICAWINGWVNNRGTDDLGRQRARYDVIVMVQSDGNIAIICF